MTNNTLLGTAPSLGTMLLGYELRRERPGTRRSDDPVPGTDVDHTLALADLEIGELAELVDAFDIPRRLFPRNRSRVVVDLVGGTVSVLVGRTDPQPEAAADRILLAYLELVHEGAEAAGPMPFTALDLDVLRGVLGSRQDTVQRHLEDLLVRSVDDPAALADRGRSMSVVRAPSAARMLTVGALVVAVASLVGVSAIAPAMLVALGLRSSPGPHAAPTVAVPTPPTVAVPTTPTVAVTTTPPAAVPAAPAPPAPAAPPVTVSGFDGLAVALGGLAGPAVAPIATTVPTEIIGAVRIERADAPSSHDVATDPATDPATSPAPEERP